MADVRHPIELPRAARSILEPLVRELSAALGARLRMAAVYGGLGRGEWTRGHDLNLLLVTESAADLEAAGPALRAARKKGVAPFPLTRVELAAAADVYAVKLDDIVHHHVLLAGEDLLEGVHLDAAHIRFVCELELRNVALRLRQRRLVVGSCGRRPLTAGIGHAVPAMRALRRLKEQSEPLATSALLAKVAGEHGASAAAMQRIWTLRDPSVRAPESEIQSLYGAFEELLAAVIEDVDALHAPIGLPLSTGHDD